MKVHSLGDGTYEDPQAVSRTDDSQVRSAQGKFQRLSREWRAGRPRGVDVAQMVEHPAYQRIIDMGAPAIPLILRELDREVDHWFSALHALTGADPVPESGRGNLSAMAEAWLNWGRGEGYIQ